MRSFVQRKPVRAPLPAHLPRERVVRPDGEPVLRRQAREARRGVTETLEMIPRQWKVIQTTREKFTCRSYKRVSQPPARSTRSRAAARKRRGRCANAAAKYIAIAADLASDVDRLVAVRSSQRDAFKVDQPMTARVRILEQVYREMVAEARSTIAPEALARD